MSSVFLGTYSRVRRPHQPQIHERRLVVPVVDLETVSLRLTIALTVASTIRRGEADCDAVTNLKLALWLLVWHGEGLYAPGGWVQGLNCRFSVRALPHFRLTL